MTYTERDYLKIFRTALEKACEQELISHSTDFEKYIQNKQDISNFYVMLLSIHSEVFEQVYKDMTEVYNSSKLLLAGDNDLDDIGLILNCTRPQATKSGVEITFKLPKPADKLLTEPEGIEVTSSVGIVYRTDEPLTFPEGETICKAFAYSIMPGVGYNVAPNQLTKITSSLKNIDSATCTNTEASTGGTNGYTDTEYRELLSHWVELNQKGNYWAYVNYFSRADAIEGYKLIPNWDGSGTLKIIIDPGVPNVLNKVYDDLTAKVAQVDEDIVLMGPVMKPIDIYVHVDVDIDRVNPFSNDEKTEIQGKIKQAIMDYFDTLKIGEDFIPHKLGVYIDRFVPELQNILFDYPTSTVVISDEEQCSLGDVQIIME